MSADLSAASWSELKATAQAIEAEVTRRESQDQADREAAFRVELDEIRSGTRAVGDEHIAHLTPREVETAVNKGQVRGIAPDRRLRRGR